MPVNPDWKNDSRIKSLNPEKIRFLTELSEQIRRTPRPQLMNQLLSINLEARKRGIVFTDGETELLTEILTERLSPAERGKLDLLRTLSKKIGPPQNKS